ncbi:porin [Azonexus fungiphilus]|uniref:porin n=1 Tax=Azonexus fungiphilus TaxID=146940 RepID=UPI00156ABB6F|nr:porin [Azonexus fungiphilus]NHC07082.1 porin [Azonexus fungiphilus]
MQKKIIALAVAAMASGAAFAQSNVTVYGIADMGYNYSSSSEAAVKVKSRSGVDSGLQSGSRLGFKGTEDLGNGLKALFTYEMGLNVDQGTSAQGGRTFGRQAFVGLTGDFGTVLAGRVYTPQFGLVFKVDPFAAGTVGDVSYGRGVYTMATGRLVGVPGEIRLDNVVAYVTPTFGGFNVIAAYTKEGIGDEERTDKGVKNADHTVWAINPNFTYGNLFVGANYHKVDRDDLDAQSKVWDLGATYDFGVAKLHALYGQAKDSVGAQNNKDKKWMVGASAPIGKFTVLASYSRLKSEGNVAALDGDKVSKWSLGSTYALSKRTNLYAAYAKMSTNDNAEGQFGVGGTGGAVDAGMYQTGFNFGLRHQF